MEKLEEKKIADTGPFFNAGQDDGLVRLNSI